jgi:lysophospholipase L1-like esterase
MKKSCITTVIVNGTILIASFLFIEVLLQILVLWVPGTERIFPISPVISDQKLGKRGNPRFPGHDEWGFRNFSIPNHSEIVALGDSMTYGTSVKSEEAWPGLLGKATGRSIYNMGFPGYGPLENRLNLDLALSRLPKLVIFGLFFGNDFYDSFAFSQEHGLEHFIPSDQVRDIQILESQSQLKNEIVNLFTLGGGKKKSGWVLRIRAWFSETWFSKNSKVYGVLRAVKNLIYRPPRLLAKDFHYAVRSLTPFQLEYCSIFEGKNWRTILTAPYRKKALDYKDLRIRVGVELSKSAIKNMHHTLIGANINFLVVLLPTKESTFWPRVESPMQHKDLELLVANENVLKNELIAFFNKEDIKYLDMLPAMLAAEVQPYFENTDGHPNPMGHKIISDQIAQYLSLQSPL